MVVTTAVSSVLQFENEGSKLELWLSNGFGTQSGWARALLAPIARECHAGNGRACSPCGSFTPILLKEGREGAVTPSQKIAATPRLGAIGYLFCCSSASAPFENRLLQGRCRLKLLAGRCGC